MGGMFTGEGDPLAPTPFNEPETGPQQQNTGFGLGNMFSQPNQNAGLFENMFGGSNSFGKAIDTGRGLKKDPHKMATLLVKMLGGL